MEKVLWRGKMRTRIKGKPKYYNSVRWLKQEGKTEKEIRKIMYRMFNQRLNRTGIHGRKRILRRSGMKWHLNKILIK